MKKIGEMLPFIAFFVYLCKITAFSASIPDSIVLSALISYIILDKLSLNAPKLAKYEKELKALREQLEKQDTDIKNVQASTNGLKLSVGMRTMNGKNI